MCDVPWRSSPGPSRAVARPVRDSRPCALPHPLSWWRTHHAHARHHDDYKVVRPPRSNSLTHSVSLSRSTHAHIPPTPAHTRSRPRATTPAPSERASRRPRGGLARFATHARNGHQKHIACARISRRSEPAPLSSSPLSVGRPEASLGRPVEQRAFSVLSDAPFVLATRTPPLLLPLLIAPASDARRAIRPYPSRATRKIGRAHV